MSKNDLVHCAECGKECEPTIIVDGNKFCSQECHDACRFFFTDPTNTGAQESSFNLACRQLASISRDTFEPSPSVLDREAEALRLVLRNSRQGASAIPASGELDLISHLLQQSQPDAQAQEGQDSTAANAKGDVMKEETIDLPIEIKRLLVRRDDCTGENHELSTTVGIHNNHIISAYMMGVKYGRKETCRDFSSDKDSRTT